MDTAREFQCEVQDEESHKEYVCADKDVSEEGIREVGAEEEGVPDDGSVDEDIEEVRDAPDAMRDHRFEPARDDECDEAIEREDAEGEREGVEFVGPERDKRVGEGWLEIGIKKEASSVEDREEERLKGEGMVCREGIDGAQDAFENWKANSNAEKNDDPCEGEGDESRGASEIPYPRGFYRRCVGGNGDSCRWCGLVERIFCGEYLGAVVPAVTVRVGVFRIGFEERRFSDIGESIEVGIENEIVRIEDLRKRFFGLH